MKKFTNVPFVKLKDYYKREKTSALVEAEEHRKARSANAKKNNNSNTSNDPADGKPMHSTTSPMA